MNEEHLRQFRKSPDSEWVEKIHTRLGKRERTQKIIKYFTRSVLALMLAFGMLLAFVPTVRAQFAYYWKKIAGMTFFVSNDLSADAYIMKVDDYWSLEEAQTRFASPISLPSYVPQGYERTSTVEHILDGYVDLVTVTWTNGPETINLFIQHCFPDLEFDGLKGANCGAGTGENSLEEITLNGKPAVLVYGSSDRSRSDLSPGMSIFWLYNKNTVYALIFLDKNLSREELIKMAESIP